ncbi:MAG TPA: hypothetical protein VII79_04245, partial [Candidatus Dormibacteraeota bacterium]
VLSPDGTLWWDGSTWHPVEAESPPADAVRSPDGTQWWDGTVWQPIPRPEPTAPAATAPIEYPVLLHWQLGTLTATTDGVVFDMTTQSGIFRKKAGELHREFIYADLREVEVRRDPDSTGLVLRPHQGDAQGCQGCTNADEVAAFVAALEQHDVAIQRTVMFQADANAPASSAPTGTRRSQIKVKSYKNEKEFERDAAKMMKDGWELEGQSEKERKTAIGRTAGKALLTGGVGLILMGRSKKGDTITVTWMR